jgi:hypothetical protein
MKIKEKQNQTKYKRGEGAERDPKKNERKQNLNKMRGG